MLLTWSSGFESWSGRCAFSIFDFGFSIASELPRYAIVAEDPIENRKSKIENALTVSVV
jgi:hypothetical protein